jgi:hypothetical protein
MRVQSQPFRCGACGREWIGELVWDAPANVVVASMKAVRCPGCACGPRKLFMVTTPAESAA